MFVQSGIYDKFIARAAEMAKTRKVGDPLAKGTQDGAIVDDIQFKRVMGYIGKGKEEGATVLAGGERVGKEVSRSRGGVRGGND